MNKKQISPQYDALSIAKYLLSLDPKREYFITKKMENKTTLATAIKGNFRLNQMLYFLQILYYLKYKKTLFDDKICAWENGMIVYSVYTHFPGLYHNLNNQSIKSIEDKETRKFIDKCFKFLKTIPDRKLQELAYTDPVWSST
jgi:uncharacterized phage-associated protein